MHMVPLGWGARWWLARPDLVGVSASGVSYFRPRHSLVLLLRRPGHRRVSAGSGLGAVVCIVLVLSAAVNMSSPLYPAYEARFGLSPLLVTLIFAAYPLVCMPTLPVLGAVSDVIGRRGMLAAGVGTAALGTGLLAVPVSAGWVAGARGLQGLAMGLAMGPATAALTERDPHRDPQRAAVYAALAFVAGTGVGPLLTGVLAAYTPLPMSLPYLAMLGLIALAGLAVSRLPPANTRPGHRRPGASRRLAWPSVPVAVRTPFAHAAANGALAWAVAALYLALVPAMLAHLNFGGSTAVIGGVVAALFGCSALTQYAARHTGPPTVQAAGLGLLLAGLGTLIVVKWAPTLLSMAGATVLTGSGLGLTFAGALGRVNGLSPPSQRGAVTAALYVVIYTGVAFPVIGVGALATETGLLPAVRAFAFLAGSACLVSLTAQALKRRRPTTGYPLQNKEKAGSCATVGDFGN